MGCRDAFSFRNRMTPAHRASAPYRPPHSKRPCYLQWSGVSRGAARRGKEHGPSLESYRPSFMTLGKWFNLPEPIFSIKQICPWLSVKPRAHSRSILNVSSVHNLEREVATGLDLFPITCQSTFEREKEGLCSFKRRKANPNKENFKCRMGKYHIMKKIIQGLKQNYQNWIC